MKEASTNASLKLYNCAYQKSEISDFVNCRRGKREESQITCLRVFCFCSGFVV
jgi:hypothetical protein